MLTDLGQSPSSAGAQPRVSPALYIEIRDWLLANDPDGPENYEWAQTITPPQTAEHLAGDIIWIILCAGRSAQAARTLEKRVFAALRAGQPAVTAFGYRAKAVAIDRAWLERDADFAAFQAVHAKGDVDAILEWCGAIPFVGNITKFQLAKNVGFDVCKPDIWLARLAGLPEKTPAARLFPACQSLCAGLAAATGDRIATVDSVLWLACNKQLMEIDAAGVRFVPRAGARRSIFEAAE
ncbi:hypothetical protein [Azospirillum argentinense]|uniref:hypothetical protein n=1 Tax=Azospirillum argentinense TaxID=2970906 RepID=UPI001FFE8EDF|nr:hypothetical protein [Azospirillum argentinense]